MKEKNTGDAKEASYNLRRSIQDNRAIVLQELIGLRVKIKSSADTQRRGISGVVIDETKHMFLIRTSASTIKVPKSGSTFIFKSGKKSFEVKGKEVEFRPYERISKGIKFYKARSV